MYWSAILFRIGAVVIGGTGPAMAEEPDRIYLLCDETEKSDYTPLLTRSIVYVVNLADKTFYPIAREENRVPISITSNAIKWQRQEHKLSDEGRFHRFEEVGSLSRATGVGEKRITDESPAGTKVSTVAMQCVSGKRRFLNSFHHFIVSIGDWSRISSPFSKGYLTL